MNHERSHQRSGLTKNFGKVSALDRLDLSVEVGEVHGFLGPNGSGKTTALRILLGLLRADAENVLLLGGDPWSDAADLRRRLAYVPGDVTQWPSLSGGEVIDLLGRLRDGHKLAEVEALCDRVSIIRNGAVVETGSIAAIRHLTRTVIEAEVRDVPAGFAGLPGVHEVVLTGNRIAASVETVDAGGAVLESL